MLFCEIAISSKLIIELKVAFIVLIRSKEDSMQALHAEFEYSSGNTQKLEASGQRKI
jgi:hypothetical protein